MHSCQTAQFLLVVVGCCSLVSGVSVEKDLTMTFSEKKALDKFREKVSPLLTKPHMKHDIYLIRWLRARNFDINAAESLLVQNLRWRKENKIDTIQQEDWSNFAKDFHTTIDTYDKEGRPIGVVDAYDWDLRTAVLQGKGQKLLRYLDCLMENITMQVFERQGRGMNVTQWKVLASADSFNIVQHACGICIPVWIHFVQGMESHFPGWLDEFIVIDASPAINVVLEAVRPFLSRQTREALKIFSANKSKWMPYLDERINREERRQPYGGTKPPAIY